MSPDSTIKRLADLLGNDSAAGQALANAGPGAPGAHVPPVEEERAAPRLAAGPCL